jgi:hypothetical protein
MDLLVAGPPGSLPGWLSDLVTTAAAQSDVEVTAATIGADHGWTPRPPGDGGIRLFLAEQVAADFITAVHSGEVRAILGLDEPFRAFAALRAAGHDTGAALRRLSASATVLGALAGTTSTIVVTGEAAQEVDAILAHSGIPLAAAELPERFRCAETRPDVEPYVLTDNESAVVEAVLVPAWRYATTAVRQAVTWPRACLFWGDRPDEPAPRVLELVGPARVLAYGPYCHLASGPWTCRAVLAFSPSAKGAPMALELHGIGIELGRRRFRVPDSGLFAVELPLVVPWPHEPLEIRLVSERGAIEGQLGIDRIEFVPRD